jgi:hypothetical protein
VDVVSAPLDVEPIRTRWQLAAGAGPDDVRALLGEVDRLRLAHDAAEAHVRLLHDRVERVRALLEDPWIDDTTHVEMLVLADVAAALEVSP